MGNSETILKLGTQACPISMVLFNLVLEVSSRAQNKQKKKKKRRKGTQIRKEEIKLYLSCFYDMILYLKNPTDPIRKLVSLINISGKVVC